MVAAAPPVNVGADDDLGRNDLRKLRQRQLCPMETNPASTVTMEITIATIGRLTKTLAIGRLPFLWVCCFGSYNGAVFDFCRPSTITRSWPSARLE